VFATNEQIADMIADPRVQGVSLTGSERAGTSVAETAGRNLKKVVLELGGSDVFVVLDTDDMDATVKTATRARLSNAGQACNSPKRFIVTEPNYDEFVAKLAESFKATPTGDPLDAKTVLGPLSSQSAADSLIEQIEDAIAKGATLLAGGKKIDGPGSYVEPTLLVDVTPEMRAYSEELFGPVGVVYKVADEDAAVALANDTSYGLGSYVFTTDEEQAKRVADKIDAGMVYVNVVLADEPGLPFGGVKRSGTSREMGLLAADEFVNKKLIRVGA